jgi:hypothetical protein
VGQSYQPSEESIYRVPSFQRPLNIPTDNSGFIDRGDAKSFSTPSFSNLLSNPTKRPTTLSSSIEPSPVETKVPEVSISMNKNNPTVTIKSPKTEQKTLSAQPTIVAGEYAPNINTGGLGGGSISPNWAGNMVNDWNAMNNARNNDLKNELLIENSKTQKQIADQEYELNKVKIEDAKATMAEKANIAKNQIKLQTREGIIRLITSGKLTQESGKKMMESYNAKLSDEDSLLAITDVDLKPSIDPKDPLAKYKSMANDLKPEDYKKLGVNDVTELTPLPERAAKLAAYDALSKGSLGDDIANKMFEKEKAQKQAEYVVGQIKDSEQKLNDYTSKYTSSKDFTNLIDENISKYGEGFLSTQNYVKPYVRDISSFMGWDNKMSDSIDSAESLIKQLEVSMLKDNKGLLSPMSEQDRKFITESMGKLTDNTSKVKFMMEYAKSKNARDLTAQELEHETRIADYNNKDSKMRNYNNIPEIKLSKNIKLINKDGDNYGEFYDYAKSKGIDTKTIIEEWNNSL